MKFAIQDTISKLPFSKLTTMRIGLIYRKFRDKIKTFLGIEDGNLYIPSYYPLVLTNMCYGDEYLLKRYCEYDDYIYAVIEHGLYFGNNQSKVPDERDDYDLHSLITLSKYRIKSIEKAFPEYRSLTIGPMIHYAMVDSEFSQKIKKKIVPGKTMLYLPIHANGELFVKYDKVSTLHRVIDVAKLHNCNNLIVCVFKGNLGEIDEIKANINMDSRINIVVTSCGYRYEEKFLDRQKTLISLSDYTISNSLGTHVGYCVYMNKPHYIIPENVEYAGTQERLAREFLSYGNNWKNDIEREKDLFSIVFSDIERETVSEEQYKLCNYYWGFDCVRRPDELKKELEEFKKFTLKQISHV